MADRLTELELVDEASKRLKVALELAAAGERSPDLRPALDAFNAALGPFLTAADALDPPHHD
jgi:hypothetical protein